jgi:hypothetical protein
MCLFCTQRKQTVVDECHSRQQQDPRRRSPTAGLYHDGAHTYARTHTTHTQHTHTHHGGEDEEESATRHDQTAVRLVRRQVAQRPAREALQRRDADVPRHRREESREAPRRHDRVLVRDVGREQQNGTAAKLLHAGNVHVPLHRLVDAAETAGSGDGSLGKPNTESG